MTLTQRRNRWVVQLGAVGLAAVLTVSGGVGLLLAQSPLAAPTNLMGDALSESAIELSWQDNAADETAYRIERSPFNSLRWEEIASLEADTTRYVDADLPCNTSYFYRARAYRATDETYSPYTVLINAVTGACPPSDVQPFSDTFSTPSLRPGWRFYDPSEALGPPAARATLTLTGTNAEISIPGGYPHDLWREPDNLAPRLLQATPNTDFALEARFESVPSTRYQLQGIIVQETDSIFLRMGTFYTGSSLNAFAAYINGPVGRNPINLPITGVTDQIFLRVIRTGDDWNFLYSADGLTWTSAGTFNEPMRVTEVGFYAGNSFDPPPSFRASADYFLNLADPIRDTDGFGEAPPPPPDLPEGLSAEVADDQVRVTWDETSLSRGQYLIERAANPDAGWDQIDAADVGETSYADTSVSCGLSYVYRIRALRDDDGRMSPYSEPVPVETAPCVDDPDSPTIDVYYADEADTLTFGQIGNPARWLNVLGNVSDPDGLASVTYAFNGGLAETLPLGPDTIRLVYPGDFNIELDRFSIPSGRYVVQIQAEDTTGAVAYRNVTIDYTDSNVWPIPYSIDWREVENITDVAQVIDGVWELTPEGLHIVKTGYDRLVAMGQDSWQGNFEAVLTFSVHDGPLHSASGMVLGWTGHEGTDRPRTRWPLEALAWLNSSSNSFLERITTFPGTVWAQLPVPDGTLDVSYTLRARTERIGNGISRVAQRMWRSDQPEPETWDISADVPSHDGSLLLVTHLTDVTFHTIDIMPLQTDRPPTPPTPLPTITPRAPVATPSPTPPPG